jgi:hypothetical protein
MVVLEATSDDPLLATIQRFDLLMMALGLYSDPVTA